MDPETSAELTAEWLLVETLPDLHRRIASGDMYDRLGIAPLLRRTLLDERPVIHIARRRLKLPSPKFAYSPFTGLPEGMPRTDLQMAGSGDGGISTPDLESDLEGFLAAPLGALHGHPITVRQVIRYFAHVEGGVHLGRPEDATEAFFQNMLAEHTFAGDMFTKTLVSLAEVTARTISPIVTAIQNTPPGTPLAWNFGR